MGASKGDRTSTTIDTNDDDDDGPHDLCESSDEDEPGQYGAHSEEASSDEDEPGQCGVCHEEAVLCARAHCGPRPEAPRDDSRKPARHDLLPFTEGQPGASSSSAARPHRPEDAELEMRGQGVGDSEGDEEAKVRMPKIPVKPSKREIEEHYARGHLPHRSWCEICVKARKKETPHRGGQRGERDVPEVSMDYAFFEG